MKKIIYCLYLLWVVLAIASFFWKGNIALATSFIWIPIAMMVAFAFILTIIGDIGARLKKRRIESEPQDCSTCIYGRTADLVNSTRKEGDEVPCVGEKLGYRRGERCPHWARGQKS